MNRTRSILKILNSKKSIKLKTGILFCSVLLFMTLPAFAGINEWTSNGPKGGLYSLAISPDYADDSTVFAGTADGLHRCIDKTNNKQLIVSTECQLHIYCTVLTNKLTVEAQNVLLYKDLGL